VDPRTTPGSAPVEQNVAVTDCAAVIATVQVGVAAVQPAPANPANCVPAAGRAVSVTESPCATASLQSL
jgi:hypothetical protein